MGRRGSFSLLSRKERKKKGSLVYCNRKKRVQPFFPSPRGGKVVRFAIRRKRQSSQGKEKGEVFVVMGKGGESRNCQILPTFGRGKHARKNEKQRRGGKGYILLRGGEGGFVICGKGEGTNSLSFTPSREGKFPYFCTQGDATDF